MWFNDEISYQNAMDAVTDQLSSSGKVMGYFYYTMHKQEFLNNFDSLAYSMPGRPLNSYFISKTEDSLTYSQCAEFDKNNGDFNYTVNKDGFRSKNFTKLNQETANILVAGCSVTFGFGLPEDKVWPNILKNLISFNSDKKIKLDNIGVCGIDSIQEIYNIFIYIEKYGRPDYIFVNLPPIYRRPDIENVRARVSTRQDLNVLHTKEEVESYLTANWKDHGINFFQNIIAIRQLEMHCKQLDIPLYWMSWDVGTQEYYKTFNFSNMVTFNIPHKNVDNLCITESDKKYWFTARDGMHVGYQNHLIYADAFYDEWKKNEI